MSEILASLIAFFTSCKVMSVILGTTIAECAKGIIQYILNKWKH